ncbi:hypothetical protein ABPG72_021686 [Tetrahymena utriculariae]
MNLYFTSANKNSSEKAIKFIFFSLNIWFQIGQGCVTIKIIYFQFQEQSKKYLIFRRRVLFYNNKILQRANQISHKHQVNAHSLYLYNIKSIQLAIRTRICQVHKRQRSWLKIDKLDQKLVQSTRFFEDRSTVERRNQKQSTKNQIEKSKQLVIMKYFTVIYIQQKLNII